MIDSHDIVVRVNNYKTSENAGFRTDVHYSFYGTSIRKTRDDLIYDGVNLCMCKCPNSQPIESEWHVKNKKEIGIDYRYIYKNRNDFWFCDTFIPDDEHFKTYFALLGNHIPTTGFACILDIFQTPYKSLYITGFDFFTSKLHNVDEPWKRGNKHDPIKHVPREECRWIKNNHWGRRVTFDNVMWGLMGG